MVQKKNIPSSKREFYSTAELADVLGVSRVAVFKKIKSGVLRAEKVGRNYVIPKEEFAAALGEFVPAQKRREIDRSIEKTLWVYGEALRRLGKE